MIKALKILVVSVLTLACLYVSALFLLGLSGFGRYVPARPDDFEFSSSSGYRRYSPPERDHAGESETNETENGTEETTDSSTESPDARDS